jgi:hypothetical protein
MYPKYYYTGPGELTELYAMTNNVRIFRGLLLDAVFEVTEESKRIFPHCKTYLDRIKK